MGIFDERKEAAEKEFVINQERSYKIKARRDRMLARWACELIGRQDVDAYLGEIAGLHGEEDVFRKIWIDLQSARAKVDPEALHAKMRHLLLQADAEVRNAGG